MKTEKHILPSCFAIALINGDWSGLTNEESRALTIFLHVELPGDAVDCQEAGFRWKHGASVHGIGGAECSKFTFIHG